MSKGGSDTQTTRAEVSPEFRELIFGPNQGRFGRFDPLGNMPDFGGILPEVMRRFQAGELAPSPVQGGTTREAQRAQIATARGLQSQFMPQVQGAFGNLQNRMFDAGGEALADQATGRLERDLQRRVMPSLSQAALGAGQFGSSRQGIAEGLAQAEASRNIGEVRGNILLDAAQREAQFGRQGDLAQLQFAPQLASLSGLPAQLLSEVGAQQDAFSQMTGESDFQNLLRMAQLVQGFIPGASQTTIMPDRSVSPLAGGLGGALTGAKLGSIVPGLGTGVGAALGGLVGLFGS